MKENLENGEMVKGSKLFLNCFMWRKGKINFI